MYNFLMTVMWVDSVLIIIAVLMQPAKTSDPMSSLSGGGGSDLFTHTKARGFDAFMQRVTVVLGIIFFVASLLLTWLSTN